MNETHYDSRLFAELYDVQPQAIIWLSPIWDDANAEIVDFEYSYCNETGLNYLGLTREQQQGLRVSVSPTLNEGLRNDILEEMRTVYRDGLLSETNIYNPVLNKYARILRTKLRGGILSIVQERTEEYRVIAQLEEKTRELESRRVLLDNLLKFSPAGITITKVIRNEEGLIIDGKTILANEGAEEFLSVPREVYLSRTVAELDPAILSSQLYKMSIRTLETGEPFHTQYFYAPSAKWIELSVSKMDNDHLINIFTDITETKTAQVKLEQAAERLQAVFNASQSGMFTFAPVKDQQGEVVDFRFVITNPTFSAYVGQSPDALHGKLGSTFFPGYMQNGVFDMYRKTYLTGETLRQEIHYDVDGHDLYLDLLSTKVHEEVLVTFTDHTTAKKIQLQQEKLVEELKRSNENLEEFAHAASHDLKEPIRKVSVFSDRLEVSLGERMNDLERSMFERMRKAADRMMLLVDDLLNYSHASLNPLSTEDVNLNEKINTVLHDLEVVIEQKKAVVTVKQLPTIKGYRRQLQQLFQNLIGNALKYSKPDVPLHIYIDAATMKGTAIPDSQSVKDPEKSYHVIKVKDNGIGFDPLHADRIFMMFQRLHGKAEYEGTGIGLSIARKVMLNHHGFIWAEGEPEQGATFYLAFEVHEETSL